MPLVVDAQGASPAAVQVTYAPYIQPGDASQSADEDQIVVTWQTDEPVPNPQAYVVRFGRDEALNHTAQIAGRVVDDYLAADSLLPIPPTAYGAHTNYTCILRGLESGAGYSYSVTGPGLPATGFGAAFHARKTGDRFSFLVMGDEGFFPAGTSGSKRVLTNYFARIVHLMFHAGDIDLPGQARRPSGDFAINTGDNVYNTGSEDSYRDFWMPVWNSDVDSADRGAPFARSIQNYIVAGNHDVGGNGDFVNLLATPGAGRYAGQTGGGDALAYFNNYYFPLNGPLGTDVFHVFNGDVSTYTGFHFSYNGASFTSPAAAEAMRASTMVDAGGGRKRQIDHMGNYFFDYGNAHFVFLDSNPHLFAGQVDYSATYAKAPLAFSGYPSVLREWLIKDLDSSSKTWKIVVYHHPAFSSGNATLRNFQMRAISRLLEDHGVNLVYNGHEHNYQRTQPLRSAAGVAQAPSAGAPAATATSTAICPVLAAAVPASTRTTRRWARPSVAMATPIRKAPTPGSIRT